MQNVLSCKQEGTSCMQGVRSCKKASYTEYRIEDAFILASPALYGVEDATVVKINTADVVLVSRMKNFNVTYTMLKSQNIYLSKRFEDTHEVWQLLAPPWPVMIAVVTPVVEPGRNTLLCEDGVELTSRPEGVFFPSALTDADADATLAIEVHPRVVAVHLCQEVLRRVGVGQIVVIVREAVVRVVEAREGDERIEDVRTAEEEDGGMHGSERAAGGHEGLTVVVTDIGEKLFDKVVEVALLLLDAPATIASEVRPGLPVNAIDTDDTDLACLDPGSKDVDHALIGEIIESAILRREGDEGVSVVAEGLVLHVAIEVATVPFMILNVHIS